MHPLTDLEQALQQARAAVLEAAAAAEHAPLRGAVEEYARAMALLFGRLLAEELKNRLALGAPSSATALVALIEGAVAAAWEAFLHRSQAAPGT